MTNAIGRACELVGGVSRMAAILGVSAPTVSQWINSRRPIPAARCPAVERATAGVVTRRELRPDDWADIWPELAAIQPQNAAGLEG